MGVRGIYLCLRRGRSGPVRILYPGDGDVHEGASGCESGSCGSRDQVCDPQ